MRVLFALLVLALFSGCAADPSRRAADGKAIVRSADFTITITEGSFHCVGEGHPNPQKYPKCKDGIPVIVLLKPNGACLSLVPYYELIVHPGRFGDTEVRWEILGPEGYEFDVNNGIKLAAKKDGNSPTNNYRGHQRRNKSSYKIDLIVGAPDDTFLHEAVVKGPSGDCVPIDPLITNKN
jgi:hypothetical protein